VVNRRLRVCPHGRTTAQGGGEGRGVNPLYLAVFFLLNALYSQLEVFTSFYGGDLGLRPMYVGIAMGLASAAAVTAQTVVKRLEKKCPTDSDIAIGLPVTAAGLATAAVPTPYTYFTGVAVSAAGQVVAWPSPPRQWQQAPTE